MKQEPDAPEPRPLTILVVDDQASSRDVIIAGLGSYRDAVIVEATNGDEALRLVAERRPDAVLCDIQMQPVDGITFLRTIRGYKDPAIGRIPVIVITGVATRDQVAAAQQAGASGILVKPISIPVLRARLDAVLRNLPG
ncbi:MAG: response regulator [Alphaproteobacteria bacterium]|nr:response regulator [Alphaproteobacteria bacterium]